MSCITNLYVIYCIIYRSPPAISHYRWYLLLHQLAAFAVDLLFSTLLIPVMLLPLPIGYVLGPLGRWLTPELCLTLAYSIPAFAMGTVCHLFMYRYSAAKGSPSYPKLHFAFILLFYLVGQSPVISIALASEEPLEVVRQLAAEFSCVTSNLTAVSGFVAYSPKTVQYLGFPVLFLTCSHIAACCSVIALIMKSLNTPSMSTIRAKLQKKFLINLILQNVIPIMIVSIPVCLTILCCMLETFGFPELSHTSFCSIAAYSMISAVVQIVSNRNYQFCRK